MIKTRTDQKVTVQKMNFFCKGGFVICSVSLVNVNKLERRIWQLYIITFTKEIIKGKLDLLRSEFIALFRSVLTRIRIRLLTNGM